MGTVQNEEVCPQCKFAFGIYELDYRRNTEWFHCERCGYGYTTGGKEEEGKGAYGVFNEKGSGTVGSFLKAKSVKVIIAEMEKGNYPDWYFTRKWRGRWYLYTPNGRFIWKEDKLRCEVIQDGNNSE